jgi:hypothetical protein
MVETTFQILFSRDDISLRSFSSKRIFEIGSIGYGDSTLSLRMLSLAKEIKCLGSDAQVEIAFAHDLVHTCVYNNVDVEPAETALSLNKVFSDKPANSLHCCIMRASDRCTIIGIEKGIVEDATSFVQRYEIRPDVVSIVISNNTGAGYEISVQVLPEKMNLYGAEMSVRRVRDSSEAIAEMPSALKRAILGAKQNPPIIERRRSRASKLILIFGRVAKDRILGVTESSLVNIARIAEQFTNVVGAYSLRISRLMDLAKEHTRCTTRVLATRSASMISKLRGILNSRKSTAKSVGDFRQRRANFLDNGLSKARSLTRLYLPIYNTASIALLGNHRNLFLRVVAYVSLSSNSRVSFLSRTLSFQLVQVLAGRRLLKSEHAAYFFLKLRRMFLSKIDKVNLLGAEFKNSLQVLNKNVASLVNASSYSRIYNVNKPDYFGVSLRRMIHGASVFALVIFAIGSVILIEKFDTISFISAIESFSRDEAEDELVPAPFVWYDSSLLRPIKRNVSGHMKGEIVKEFENDSTPRASVVSLALVFNMKSSISLPLYDGFIVSYHPDEKVSTNPGQPDQFFQMEVATEKSTAIGADFSQREALYYRGSASRFDSELGTDDALSAIQEASQANFIAATIEMQLVTQGRDASLLLMEGGAMESGVGSSHEQIRSNAENIIVYRGTDEEPASSASYVRPRERPVVPSSMRSTSAIVEASDTARRSGGLPSELPSKSVQLPVGFRVLAIVGSESQWKALVELEKGRTKILSSGSTLPFGHVTSVDRTGLTLRVSDYDVKVRVDN